MDFNRIFNTQLSTIFLNLYKKKKSYYKTSRNLLRVNFLSYNINTILSIKKENTERMSFISVL